MTFLTRQKWNIIKEVCQHERLNKSNGIEGKNHREVSDVLKAYV